MYIFWGHFCGRRLALTAPTCALADCSRRAHGAAPVATQVRYSSLAREWPPRRRRGCAQTPTTPLCVPSPPPPSRDLAVAQDRARPALDPGAEQRSTSVGRLDSVCIALRGPRRALDRFFIYKHSANTALNPLAQAALFGLARTTRRLLWRTGRLLSIKVSQFLAPSFHENAPSQMAGHVNI